MSKTYESPARSTGASVYELVARILARACPQVLPWGEESLREYAMWKALVGDFVAGFKNADTGFDAVAFSKQCGIDLQDIREGWRR